MTDATAGRQGGVGIRLFIQGSEVVKRGFREIGDSGKKMWAEIALGERSANPAIRALSLGANEVKQGFEGLAARAGSLGTSLSAFGFAGLAAAAALGALAVATQGAFDAMKSAADLTDAADRIGVGVEALQEWRYVADEAGVETATLEGVMEKLNGTLGKFKMGLGDAKLKPAFEELGITKDQLANVQTADQLLLLLADTLGQVQDRAKQVALARTLGVEEALPVIRLGRQELERLTGAAHDLGLVLDQETVKSLDEADRKMELAGQQIKMLTTSAVEPLATALANAGAWVANWSNEMDRVRDKGPGWVEMLRRIASALPGGVGFQSAWDAGVARARRDQSGIDPGRAGVDVDDPALRWQQAAVAGSQANAFDLKGHTAKGGGSSSAAARAQQAEREAEQRRQREERATQQIERAADDLARTYGRGNLSIDDKAAYEVVELEVERAARLREIARAEEEYIRSKGLRGLTEAEAEQLRASQDELTEKKKAIVEWARRRDLAARRLKDEEDAAQAAVELLDIDAQMARTHSERFRIEREILLATIEIARKRKKAALENDPELSDDQRADLLASFNRNANAQVELFDHQETERLRAQFKSYGREVADAIREGRIGEYIANELKDRLLDGALDQLFNLFSMNRGDGAGGASGAGSWLSSAFSVVQSAFQRGPGRAGGGDVRSGFRYPIVEHGKPELFMIGGAGHVTSAVETARMLRESLAEVGPGFAGGAPILQQTLKFDNRGAVMTADLLRNMEEMAASTGAASVAASRETVPTDMARTQRYTLSRRR